MPLRGTSMQRFAPLDWSVRLRGANPNDAPGPPDYLNSVAYWVRIAITGSTRAARRAGTQQASSATADRPSTTPT
jgi:hypothetical protein